MSLLCSCCCADIRVLILGGTYGHHERNAIARVTCEGGSAQGRGRSTSTSSSRLVLCRPVPTRGLASSVNGVALGLIRILACLP